jgi:Tol biopolymer transport system component
MKRAHIVKYVLITLVIITIIVCVILNNKSPDGEIVFRITEDMQSEIIVMDANGNNLQWVGHFSGSPTWSTDGKYIAVGCEYGICILDITTLHDRRNDFSNQSIEPDMEIIQNIPDQCYKSTNYDPRELNSGILSISWSPNDSKLAIVCGNERKANHSVCIISLYNESKCWENENAKKVERILWSPVDDNRLAITLMPNDEYESSTIFFTNSDGEDYEYIADGFGVDWSSDGKRIIYITEDDDGFQLIIRNLVSGNNKIAQVDHNQYLFQMCKYYNGCRISWSPDERYVIFAYKYGSESYLNALFRIDLYSGKTIRLIDPLLFDFPAEADWK